MKMDPRAVDWDLLLADGLPDLATPGPSAEFAAQLETRLRVATAARVRAPHLTTATWLRLSVAAAVLVVAAIGLTRIGGTWASKAAEEAADGPAIAGGVSISEEPSAEEPRREVIASIALSYSDVQKSASERRMSLGQLIERSDVILSGRVDRVSVSGKYRLQVHAVLKGQGQGFLALSNPDSNPLSCPGPPTWSDGRWTVLFCVGGRVFSDQWKPEFEDDIRFLRFQRRVRAYFDGSVLPTLLEELSEGGGPGPFAEPDRLVIDAVPQLVATADADGLFRVAERFELTGQATDAVRALAEVGGVHAVRGLRAIRDGQGWPNRFRYLAIESLGRVGGGLLDESTVAAILDPMASYRLRQAAVIAAGYSGRSEFTERIITLWSRIEDQSQGPAEDGGRQTKGYYVKAAALVALGRIGDARARAFLLEVLRDGDDYFGYRARAADGLAELGDPTVIPDLRRALGAPGTDTSSRGFITKAIEGLSGAR